MCSISGQIFSFFFEQHIQHTFSSALWHVWLYWKEKREREGEKIITLHIHIKVVKEKKKLTELFLQKNKGTTTVVIVIKDTFGTIELFQSFSIISPQRWTAWFDDRWTNQSSLVCRQDKWVRSLFALWSERWFFSFYLKNEIIQYRFLSREQSIHRRQHWLFFVDFFDVHLIVFEAIDYTVC